MTRERAKSMDQRAFGRSCTADAARKLASAAHGFPGTPPNANIHNVPRVHLGSVGKGRAE